MEKVPVEFKEYEGLYLFVDDECTPWAPIAPICKIFDLNVEEEAEHTRNNPAFSKYFTQTPEGEHVLELTYLDGWLNVLMSDAPDKAFYAGVIDGMNEAYEDAFFDYTLEGEEDDDDDDFDDDEDDTEIEISPIPPDVTFKHVETTDLYVRLWKKAEKRELYGNYKVYCHFGKQQKVADGYELLDDKLYRQILKEGVPLYFQTDVKITDAKSSDKV